MSERKSLDQLAEELEVACDTWIHRDIRHVKSGAQYRIVGLHFRESDMALCVEYTPVRSTFFNRVKFARSIDEMEFGSRFVFPHVLATEAVKTNHEIGRNKEQKTEFLRALVEHGPASKDFMCNKWCVDLLSNGFIVEAWKGLRRPSLMITPKGREYLEQIK